MLEQKKRDYYNLTILDLFLYLLSFKVKHVISLLILVSALWIGFMFNKVNVDFDKLLVKLNCSVQVTKAKYKVYGKNADNGHLKHVYAVLHQLGYERDDDPNSTDWTLLWAHDYPFRAIYSQISSLNPNQKINHFPGCGYITNKVDLSTSQLKYVPLAFKLPEQREQLLAYAVANPEKMFVQKSNDHRNIKIQKIEEADLTGAGTFVQEYIDRPLLVDGHKFDVGVYTVITSLDPLRVYMYNGDVLFRYCLRKYYPFDPSDLNKYVVGDDYLPTWEVPSLTHLYSDLGFSMRDSFDAYVRSRGSDPEVIWLRIEDALRTVILNKEEAILNVVERFKSKDNFFEMMRFDFVIDEDLEVYLMEANMSPNLSSAHYPPNRMLYEQVLHSLFSLVGLSLRRHDGGETLGLVSDKSLSVFPLECSSELCRDSCVSSACQLCSPCLSPKSRINFARAYIEHVYRRDCKRIFPPTMLRDENDTSLEQILNDYSAENQLQYRWFLGKCLLDKSWC